MRSYFIDSTMTGYKIKILFILYCTCTFSSDAQQSLHYDQFTSEKGLSENVVYCVHKDKKGFIWAGTDYGLNRFDGYSFKKYFHDPADSNTLSNQSILSINEDEFGKFWIVTYNGLNRFDPASGKVERIRLPKQSPIPVQHIFFTGKNELLVVVDLARSYVYNYATGNWFTIDSFSVDIEEPLFFKNEQGLPVIFYGDKKLKPENVVVFDGRSKQWRLKAIKEAFPFSLPSAPLSYFNKYGLHFLYSPGTAALTIFNDAGAEEAVLRDPNLTRMTELFIHDVTSVDSGKLWIATNKGLLVYDMKAKEIGEIQLIGDSKSLPGNKELRCLLNDYNGNIWIGVFGEGLLRCGIRPSPFKNIPLPELTGGNFQRMIFGLYKWPGNLVAAETGFRNFAVIDKARVSKWVRADKLSFDEVLEITTGKKSAELNAFQKNVLQDWYQNASLLPFKFIIQDDTTVINLYSITFETPSRKKQLSLTLVGNCLAEEEYYWLPTIEGLYRFRKKDFSFDLFKNDGRPYCLSESATYHVAMDENKTIWVGTKGGGLNYFKANENRFYKYTTEDGLPDNVVYFILPDNKGSLWLTTNKGISRFNLSTKTFTNFSNRDGLLNSEFNRQGGLLIGDSTIYLSGTSGIDYFNLYKIPSSVTPPVVNISELSINNSEVNVNEKNIFRYRENNFSISYTANDFTRPDLVYFRYRLNASEEWTRVQGINIVLYNALSPGSYNFEIQASYDNLNWSKSAFYPFNILKPWWRTTWFYVSIGVVIALSLVQLYRYRIRQLQKVYKLRTKISQDLHDEVGSTLSSIHIFSSVASKAMDKDPLKAKDALQQINSNTRRVMDNMSDIVWAINTGQLGETTFEIKLKNYGYELLTPLNIQCLYEIDKEADRKLLNMEARKNILLVAKEAMNNIAKYSHAQKAEIRAYLLDGNFILQIKDDGKGFDENRHIGNGMFNMKKRTEDLGGSLRCISSNTTGTEIRCTIPITNISD